MDGNHPDPHSRSHGTAGPEIPEIAVDDDSSSGKDTLDKESKSVFSIYRVLLPIVIGVAVVGYLMYVHFDWVEFNKISWGRRTWTWIGIGVLMLIGRHLSYTIRLWLLSGKQFSFWKCVELIFIWEFSSAVSPTNVGGSAVALVVLSREKLSSARTAAIVLYSVVADTFFFVASLGLWLLIIGAAVIRPGIADFSELDNWGVTFFVGYGAMIVYGLVFAYGLFIDPRKLKLFLDYITRIRPLRRLRERALRTGVEFVEASREMTYKRAPFHIKAFALTAAAWSFRFLFLVCIMLALVPGNVFDGFTQLVQYARIQAMYVIIAFSPTPGGSGIAEFAVTEFLSDFIPAGIALVVAFSWRILDYYLYLLIGAIVVPNWVRKIYRRRKLQKATS